MQELNNRRILLGVTGGIAAYKSAELVRRLQDHGASVRVVMTKAATEFITPLTLQALSGQPVHLDLLDTEAEAAMGHIELARWADAVLVAPASADFMARLAHGHADDLLTAVCLATKAPIAIAPAMNQGMWRNAVTQRNRDVLVGRHIHVFGPAEGSQACGDVGPGRMLEPDQLAADTARLFKRGVLAGKKVIITAGPTREAIDPVRYLSNHSSGKMGFAIAQAAVDAGATVTLIAGPVTLATPERVRRVDVVSAEDMYNAAMAGIAQCDIFIAAAAVADYRPAEVAADKIKKSAESLTLTLTRNRDIVAAVAALPDKPFTVGFAAETQHVIEHARTKLANKRLDMIVANDVADSSIGFNSEDNAATVLWQNGQQQLARTSKHHIAVQLIDLIAAQCPA